MKKVQKLKDFTVNSYSYLQVILFQCKVKAQRLEKNPNPHQIEALISKVLGTSTSAVSAQQQPTGTSDEGSDLVRANSLKMMYAMLRDNNNMYPQMQKRLLKRYIEKQVAKLR